MASSEKLEQLILWHDNNIVITVENCGFTLCQDDTNALLPYRWLELDTGQKFAELEGWHYRYKIGNWWKHGWETIYEETFYYEG